MTVKMLQAMPDMGSAARALCEHLEGMAPVQEHFCLKIPLECFDFEDFFSSVRGMVRWYFKSRDQDLELCGLGIADRVCSVAPHEKSVLTVLREKASTLFDNQCYFGGTRFDIDSSMAPEWQSFGRELFVLPLLLVQKTSQSVLMMINFRSDGCVAEPAWRDQVFTLLNALSHKPLARFSSPLFFSRDDETPKKDHYFRIIEHALSSFARWPKRQKVVIGRRNSLFFDRDQDPLSFLVPLAHRSESSFLFLLDNGQGAAFFGASPELLYRRDGSYFATESLAGTRPRSIIPEEDERLKKELYNSAKDQSEHAFVCEHVEGLLRDFGARNLLTSKLEVMSLSYVRHLVRRYSAFIESSLGDDTILSGLHPTPAVSGTERPWALQFIREQEGFDRGFYAGPIGYVHREGAEFAVAIRSALYHAKKLSIYAASGIVPGSLPEQEWEELTNKQKKIMSIFD